MNVQTRPYARCTVTKINHDRLERVYARHEADPVFEHFRAGSNPFVGGEGGNPIAMIIGEALGRQEAAKRRPFVGPAGTVLRELMAAANLFATPSTCGPPYKPNCWLTNVVKWRPLNNRTPTLLEVQDSRRHLRAEWVAIGKPDIIITIGSTPLTAVTGRKASILARAGQMFSNYNSERKPQSIVFWPMIHPAFALRNDNAWMQPVIEEHWLKLAEWLNNHPKHGGRANGA